MANEKIEDNRERSVQKSFSLKNRQIDFMNKNNLGSEWLQTKVDEEIKNQKQFEFLKFKPFFEESKWIL